MSGEGERRQPALRRSTKSIHRESGNISLDMPSSGDSSSQSTPAAAPAATVPTASTQEARASAAQTSSKDKSPLAPSFLSSTPTTSYIAATATPTSPRTSRIPFSQHRQASSSTTNTNNRNARGATASSSEAPAFPRSPSRMPSSVMNRKSSHARSATNRSRAPSVASVNSDEDAADPSFFAEAGGPGPSLSRRPTRDDLYSAMHPTQSAQDPADDEIKTPDRGEELIRRRMKERKKEKKRQAAIAAHQQPRLSRVSSAGHSRPLSSALSHRAASSTGIADLTEAELSELDDEADPNAGDAPTAAAPGTGSGTIKRPNFARRSTQDSVHSSVPPLSPRIPISPEEQQQARFQLEQTSGGSQPVRPQHHHQQMPAAAPRRVSYAVSHGGTSTTSTPGEERSHWVYQPDAPPSETGRPGADAGSENEQQALGADDDSDKDTSEDNSEEEDVEYTLKDRQDAINIEHPFGLPIWKPALYKKSRSVTRNADANLHLDPSSAAERHLAPGNILWTVLFGLWLLLVCAVLAALLSLIPWGGSKYGRVVFDLGVYLFWPFGRYVEGWDQDAIVTTQDGHTQVIHALEGAATSTTPAEPLHAHSEEQPSSSSQGFGDADSGYNDSDGESLDVESDGGTFGRKSGLRHLLASDERRGSTSSAHGTIRIRSDPNEDTTPPAHTTEDQPLLAQQQQQQQPQSYGSTADHSGSGSGSTTVGHQSAEREAADNRSDITLSPPEGTGFRFRAMGRLSYWAAFYLVIAPLMLAICLVCWFLVFTIPMAKLLYVLVRHLHREPLALHFRSAPKYHHSGSGEDLARPPPPLKAGQFAPKHSPKVYAADRGAGRLVGPKSKILLCTYKAFGLQYYKYTVDGVNIMFINLVPVIFLTIFSDFVLRRSAEKSGQHFTGLLALLSSQATIFILGLASVIPLSYFIGMAVASISAQSSIGMGAVINATFGSIIEIILYSIALSQGKANLVEGSIIGSLLAGVLLMPGGSMISGSFRRKEQRFNARSAGVTSTMLIMAIIGTLTPTLFYEIFGTFQLTCEGCPETSSGTSELQCSRCSYEHIDPADDPFYNSTVRYLSYDCAAILVLSYLIGLWFSLRTHASQIWQNSQGPQPPAAGATSVPASATLPHHMLHPSLGKNVVSDGLQKIAHSAGILPSTSQSAAGRPQSSVDAGKPDAGQQQQQRVGLPEGMSDEDYRRAVDIVATASAFHHQHNTNSHQSAGPALRRQPSRLSQIHPRDRSSMTVEMPKEAEGHAEGGHGGHDAPNWSRSKSFSVLLGCTLLYTIISEILVDVVDVVLDGSGIPEKFLGVTLFALVPNTTEFMNAFSFALTGNIALSMEIGSAYALQVCLLQIPAMVAVTYFYSLSRDTMLHHAFTLVFPRWDVIAILFSVFLLTYVYLEARANYYRGSILVFAYVVLLLAFYYTPTGRDTEDSPDFTATTVFPATGQVNWLAHFFSR